MSSFLINVLRKVDVVSLNMNAAKIQLSQDELLLVQNGEWLLTKNRIIEKVQTLFGLLIVDVQKLFTEHHVPLLPEDFAIPPKISKGENYQGLPYVMLDYPRCFGKDDIFAVRTMFWWGNFFSTTLHLKGKYKNDFAPILKKKIAIFSGHPFYINIQTDQWRHDFALDNYKPILEADAATIQENLIKKDFCKISGKVDLQEWNTIHGKLIDFYKMIIKGITINFRDDETDL